MSRLRSMTALVLVAFALGRIIPQVSACGPTSIEPIFVFEESPDLPFENFTNGNIGIVQPTFGRKTLVIAYRYLNGGAFSLDEQKQLIKALKGIGAQEESTQSLKTWIAARKNFLNEDEKLPEIYVERQHGGYDYFPNCTQNAFEVATETLKDRAASHGADDPGIRQWLAAQDTVFKNCVSGSSLPEEIGPEKPLWLRKDRDYQIAAALFYSLSFDQARARFEQIATDIQSPWQQTAEYLVPRTLVRQASLSQNDSRKRQLYEQAEIHLQTLASRAGKFQGGSRRLLGLVKYRLHPEERVRELARSLSVQNGNENLGQDLIDYVWLLDKFETRILKAEEERKKGPNTEKETNSWFSKADRGRYEAIQRGELIEVRIYLKKPDGTTDYSTRGVRAEFKNDVSESEIFQTFEIKLGRKITSEEAEEIRTSHKSALSYRDYLISPNRQLQLPDYEGDYSSESLSPDKLPDFLRFEDLSDWIFSVQSDDPATYKHAFKRWRDTGSHGWLTAALMKAERSSAGLDRLMRAAERVERQAPAFAGILFHRIRLKVATGQKSEARELLDRIIASGLDQFPVSTRNLFTEQRMGLAEDLNVFLTTGVRMPVAFYYEGRIGKLSEFREAEQSFWNPEYHKESKEEFERRVEEKYRQLLPWNERLYFDPKTTEILDTYFSLPALMDVARSPAVPDYLRRSVVLAIWTRSVLLKNQAVADKVVPDVLKLAPEMTQLFEPYQEARTLKAKQQSALVILLKAPLLSPFIADGFPSMFDSEELSYYYESAWWCPPSGTDYDQEGNQIPKSVPVPWFLAADQLAIAKRDHAALIAIGDAKIYLGKRVLEWARTAPDDPRLPEALFIAARANAQYKYGCSGWDHDRKIKEEAENILLKRYPSSPWTAKLAEPSN